SVRGQTAVVYVDSASSDGSRECARSLGVQVVELDPTVPFTAGRARQEGFERLLQLDPKVEFVHFVDGDCEVVDGWLGRAGAELRCRRETAVLCGRRRERFPEASVYNRWCDLEWDTPVGEALSCGGDSLARVTALKQVGGFDVSVPAGEE